MNVSNAALRNDTIAMITAWVHDDQESLYSMMKDLTIEHALDATLVAAALVRCWADAIQVPHELLIQDLAMVCAVDKTV